jgi:hypothetical protein
MRLVLPIIALALHVPAHMTQITYSEHEAGEESCQTSSASMLSIQTRLQKRKSTVTEASQASLCEAAAPSLEKVRDIARDLESRGKLSTGNLSLAAGKVLGGAAGEEVLQAIEEIMDKVDLNEAMETGDVVTSADLRKIAACELNREESEMEDEVSLRDEDGTEGKAGMSALSWEYIPFPTCEQLKKDWDQTRDQPCFAGQWLWPSGQVRYCFHASCRERCQTAWESAVAEIQEQVPGLSFEEKCGTFPALMVRSDGSGCYTGIGFKWWRDDEYHDLYLSTGCEFKGIAMHEALHALGLDHEQNRPDRDEHVTILWDNIQPGMTSNFDKRENMDTGSLYDVLSIMHYSSASFSSNRQNTMEPKNEELDAKYLGQSMGLSELDALLLCKMYDCTSTCKPKAQDKERLQELLGVARTEQGCTCKPEWSHPTTGAICADAENRGCCATWKRTWCFTQFGCGTASGDGAWDFCTPRGKLKTKQGCVCRPQWERGNMKCATNMGCCGPTGDTWCKTEGEHCGNKYDDYRWDSCTPP